MTISPPTTGQPSVPGPGERRPRRRLLWGLLILGAGLAVFVAVWFQPQKLFIDETVNDSVPLASGSPAEVPSAPVPSGPGPSGPTTTVAFPEVLAAGQFVSRDHGTSGGVRVLDLENRRIVRLEGLDTDNGPDLHLYLTTNPADGDEGAFDDDFVSLGRLKGNRGDQNYDLPAGVDLGRYRSVVVWCDRFNSAFGAADLAAA